MKFIAEDFPPSFQRGLELECDNDCRSLGAVLDVKSEAEWRSVSSCFSSSSGRHL